MLERNAVDIPKRHFLQGLPHHQSFPLAVPDLNLMLHHLIMKQLILVEKPLLLIIDVIVIGVVDDIVNAHLAAFQLAFIRDCYVLPQHV